MQADFYSTALFSLAATLSLTLTALITDVTLTKKYSSLKTFFVWLAFLIFHFMLSLFGYSMDVTNDTIALVGIMVVSPIPTLLLYTECTPAKVFVPVMGSLISNVMTFFFCGTTLSFLDHSPNPYNVRTLLVFNGIKIFWFVILYFIYRIYISRIVKEVVKVLEHQIKRYVPIPIYTFLAFFCINRITNALGVMPAIPETRIVFIFFYLIVCSIFVVLYWEIFSTALWSSRALKTEAELNVASNIQRDMLPNIFPPFPERTEFEIYATMTPAKEVGGDFYDFFLIDENHLAVVIADVSGKGVPAALFMVIAKTLIKDYAQIGGEVADVFTQVNKKLCETNDEGLFVTAWLGVLEISTGHMKFVNAGHNLPLVRHKDGTFEYMQQRPGFVLAGMEGIIYKSGELDLRSGDTLYLYTDGVTEATSAAEELYGDERLQNILNRNLEAEPEQLLKAVKQDIDEFVNGAPQFDDITMLGLTLTGNQEGDTREGVITE